MGLGKTARELLEALVVEVPRKIMEVLVLPVREMLVEGGQSEAPTRRLPAVAAVELMSPDLAAILQEAVMAGYQIFWERLTTLQAAAVEEPGSHPLLPQVMVAYEAAVVEEKPVEALLELGEVLL